MRTLTGGTRDGIYTRYDTRKMHPTARASVSLRAKWQVLYRVIPLLLRWCHGRCWIMMVECIPQTHVLILSMFWHIQTDRVSLYIDTRNAPRLLAKNKNCRASFYIILQHFQNVPRTTTQCFAQLTQTNLPRLLICIPIIRTAPHYIPRLIVPNTLNTACRCSFHTNDTTKRYYRVSLYLPHLVVSFTQTNLRRISLFSPHKRFVHNLWCFHPYILPSSFSNPSSQ